MMNYLSIVPGLIGALLAISFLIFVHELGHFLVGRWCGIFIQEFAVGLGPRLWSYRRGETIYSWRCIPFGGFVRFAAPAKWAYEKPQLVGQKVWVRLYEDQRISTICTYDPAQSKDKELRDSARPWRSGMVRQVDWDQRLSLLLEEENKTIAYAMVPGAEVHTQADEDVFVVVAVDQRFYNKSIFKRFLTYFGGPLFNILFAIPAFMIYTGIVQNAQPMISTIVPESPAAEAGVQAEDVLIGVGGHQVSGKAYTSTMLGSAASAKKPFEVQVRRGAEEKSLMIEPSPHPDPKVGLGIPAPVWTMVPGPTSFGALLQSGFEKSWGVGASTLRLVGYLVTGQLQMRGPGAQVGGPLMAIYTFSQSFVSWESGMFMLASFSMTLALLNLIPFIPVLDGGRIALLLLEAMRGRPLSGKYEMRILIGGALFLLLFMLSTTVIDVINLSTKS